MPLFCSEIGNKAGQTIVFIHGGGISSWMWDNQIEFFKGKFNCLAPDLPGHGNSKHEEYISTRDCSEKIIEIIETKSKGKKVILVGFSLGAQIVVDILSIRSDLVERTLINSGLVRPFKMLNFMIPLMAKWSIPLAKSRKFARFQSNYMYISDSSFETYYQDTKFITAKTFSAFMLGYFDYKLLDSFKKMSVPSLILISSKEPGMMKKSLNALIKSNPNCKGYIMKHVRHGACLAKPKLFNEVLSAWINNQPLPPEIHEFL